MTGLPPALTDGGFAYRDGRLFADAVALADIADAVGTPTYVYAATGIRSAYTVLAEALADLPMTICYAVKANSNLAVIRLLGSLGCGADVVSGGELRRALMAGIPADRIVFSGAGKSREDLALAVDAGLLQVNVESTGELHRLSDAAVAAGRNARIAIRINPDVDAMTLSEITTGTRDNKFGIDIERAPEVYRLARTLPGLQVAGVAVHIGSQIDKLAPFQETYTRIANLVRTLRADGLDIEQIDLGGGLAIPYREERRTDIKSYADLIRQTVGPLNCRLMIEPGRYLVGNAGVMLSRVVEIKTDLARPFAIVDAAMNDLVRPAMYKAWHEIVTERQRPPDAPHQDVDVVGPVCESTDTFARGRHLPVLSAGDLVAFASAGAYGATMSFEYNTRPLVPEVLVGGSRFDIVRKRPTFEDMVRDERMPDWLETEF